MSEQDKKIDKKVEELFREIVDEVRDNQKRVFDENEYFDNFDEYIKDAVNVGVGVKRPPCSACDECKKKQVIIEQYNRVCNKEYIPPYIDKDCRDFKLSLVIQRIDDRILESVFSYLIYRVSIREILCKIDDPEWKRDGEALLASTGYNTFIQNSFGKINKNLIIQMLFDVNYCYFNADYKRNLSKSECQTMIKYFIVITLRNRLKESLFKIAKLIELELEYKIAVIEGEIRYIIKCILQEIVITPLPATNYNITFFNKIGSLTELLKIYNGFEGGKHDERSDFRHIRDTINKYEKVVRTSLDLLNSKIKEYGDLTQQRTFIVGVTGICERPNVFPEYKDGIAPVVVPPVPVVILSPPKDREEENNFE